MTAPRTLPRTLIDKIWDAHVVAQDPGSPAVLYVDLHLVHEVTSPQAFAGLRARGLRVRRPDRTVATMDHVVPTLPRGLPVVDERSESMGGGDPAGFADGAGGKGPRGIDERSESMGGGDPAGFAGGAGGKAPRGIDGEAQLRTLAASCAEHGITLHGMDSDRQGIVHVIGPELGLTHPGQTIVCGDSHTSTHGAFGALAFGIGTSEVEHVLATQCLLQHRPRTLEVRVDGALAPGVTAKDVALALIARIGVAGATGHVIEYTGAAIRALDMEGRMTVCNMSIEAGARAGMIAPDEVTFAYLEGREHAPRGDAWPAAVARWRALAGDDGARFDRTVALDGAGIEPMITFGTNPGMGIAVTGRVPSPEAAADAAQRAALDKALRYMELAPGEPLLGRPIDVVFIGSCTNARITDLRAAATVMAGRKVATGVRALVVPGSRAVKRQAEREGLDQVFRSAGAEWREPGCSMCIAMNGDRLEPGQYAVSTSNRNFEGRQGPRGRTFLASPLTAAAAAVTGRITDARQLARGTP